MSRRVSCTGLSNLSNFLIYGGSRSYKFLGNAYLYFQNHIWCEHPLVPYAATYLATTFLSFLPTGEILAYLTDLQP
ncbi:MAG: hypothetical protein WD077_07755 [Bacteroidia bacterium]